jgi:sulfide:quinone oxidoreductase
MKTHYQVLIIGGGTAGLMVSARLKRQKPDVSMAIIEPSKEHWYQPAWTLVGAGTFAMEDTRKQEKDYIPKGVDWIQDYASALDPEQNKVSTRTSGDFTYDFLVVAPGLVNDFSLMPGLEEALQTDSVCSNYVDPEKTWKVLQNFKGGNAVFTQPTTPIKCGGAPQKIMYLAEEYFRKEGLRDKTNVIYATPGSVIFGVKEFAKTLNKIIQERDIILKTFYAPKKIDAKKKEIYFEYAKPGENTCVVTEDNKIQEYVEGAATVVMPYDMLHLAPPQAAPAFIKDSKLSHQDGPNKGWLNVDKNTLQHNEFPNVFGLGDVAALPTAKTGAAIRKQAPVVVENLAMMIDTQKLSNKQYEGYSSCPLVTGYGKMVLAEFKYDNVRDSDPLISTFVDTTKEQWSMWMLKKYGLPYLYWNRMLKGKM